MFHFEFQFSTIRFFNDLFNGKKKCWTTRNASQKQPRVCVFSTLHFSSFSEISFFVKAKRDILTAWKNGREWRKGKLGLQKTFLHCTLHFTMPIKRRTLQQNNRSQKEHLHFDDYNSDDALQKWQISTYRNVWYLANATSRASVPSFMIFMTRLD